MKIAVTGATGHIGANLCRVLLEQGHELRVLCRNQTDSLKGLDMERIHGDVLDESTLDALVKGTEMVFHLAAIISVTGDPDGQVMKTNVEGPRKVAAACLRAGVRRLVHFSSVHAFEPVGATGVLDEHSPLVGARGFAYDKSKAAGQREILKAVAQGLDAVILNPTGVIGPHDYQNSLMGQTFRRLYRGSLPSLVRGGFDFVDVRDVVAAAVAAMDSGRTGDCHLLAGHYCQVSDLAAVAEQVTGRKAPAVQVPIWLAKAGVPFFGAYAWLSRTHPLYTFESLEALRTGSRHISTERARNQLGFQVRPLADSVRDIYDWFHQHNLLT